ncbi:ABC transporter ATP-binding protein [Streptomyces sp. NPDC057636]|uniref:ABC transporter ATP-binding protein n=1 Tax=Streptomyces sp. NPDC057636 TaxID=3346189 RepID=UPI0036BC2DA8
MLTVDHLHAAYGNVRAVRDVSLGAAPGRITLVLGPNGAGKTTTLRTVAGLHKLSGGSVILDGRKVTGASTARLVSMGLALVPEGRRIFAPLTVQENLRLGGYSRGRNPCREGLDTIYSLFPILAERRDVAGGLLSGGEQQMLAFGRALMSRPKVMLMDEPSMGLAPAMVEVVLDKVRAIADTGVSIVVVEQNADVGLEIADDVIVMDRGEVVFTGTSADARSHTSVVQAFLGEVALSDGAEAER